LRRLDHAESVPLPWHGQIFGIVTSNLKKNAAIGAALIGLPSGMQEARAKAEACGDAPFVAHGVTDRLERGFVRVIHLDETEQSEVIAGFEAAQMRPQIRRKRGIFSRCLFQSGGILFIGKELDAILLEDWRFLRKRAGFFVLVS